MALADDVATELLQMPRWYSSRITSVPGQGTSGSKAADREARARYQVFGNVHQLGDVTHVNVQLIEAERSRPLWGQSFTYPQFDNSGERTRLVAQIARAVVAQVLAAETRRPLPSQPEAGQFVMLGLSPKAGEFGMESNRQAKAQYERALALDPNSVPALLGYVRTRLDEVLNSWAPKDAWSVLLDEAERAIAHAAGLEPRNAAVHVVRGQYLRTRTKDAEAVAALAHALTLYSRFPAAHAELGRAKIEVGLAKEAVGHIEEAILLSPADPSLFTWYLWAGMAETPPPTIRELDRVASQIPPGESRLRYYDFLFGNCVWRIRRLGTGSHLLGGISSKVAKFFDYHLEQGLFSRSISYCCRAARPHRCSAVQAWRAGVCCHYQLGEVIRQRQSAR